eukprot:scaffold89530_cov35-Tisochrysis_lutea.AAC.2
MCEKYGARVRGVIINKVRPEKLDMVRDYFGRAVEDRTEPNSNSFLQMGGALAWRDRLFAIAVEALPERHRARAWCSAHFGRALSPAALFDRCMPARARNITVNVQLRAGQLRALLLSCSYSMETPNPLTQKRCSSNAVAHRGCRGGDHCTSSVSTQAPSQL